MPGAEENHGEVYEAEKGRKKRFQKNLCKSSYQSAKSEKESLPETAQSRGRGFESKDKIKEYREM